MHSLTNSCILCVCEVVFGPIAEWVSANTQACISFQTYVNAWLAGGFGGDVKHDVALATHSIQLFIDSHTVQDIFTRSLINASVHVRMLDVCTPLFHLFGIDLCLC